MFDFRKVRKWLIVIPFCALHIVGAPSIVSNLLLKNFYSKNLVDKDFYCKFKNTQEFDINKVNFEKVAEKINIKDEKDLEFDKINSNNFEFSFIKNLAEKSKNSKNNKEEMFICDNKIDSEECIEYIDENFLHAMGLQGFLPLDDSFVIFA